jgi:hypothetical protein
MLLSGIIDLSFIAGRRPAPLLTQPPDHVARWHKATGHILMTDRLFRGEHCSTLALNASVANDAVDGAHSAASRCHRVVASKREIQRAEVDVGSMKEASAQISQTNW